MAPQPGDHLNQSIRRIRSEIDDVSPGFGFQLRQLDGEFGFEILGLSRGQQAGRTGPLPAGLEPVNPAFTVSQTFAPDDGLDDGSAIPADGWCWCWQWFEHQNLRDDRAEAFTSFLAGGTYEYTYIARATTPGTFVVPPARAEELYAPEVFGRSASDTVVVG